MSDFGGQDFGELLSQMQQLQSNLEEMNDMTSAQEVEGTAGGGAVKIQVSGEFDFAAVHIDPSIVDPNAVDLLEDLLLAALRDAASRVLEARKQAVGQVMSSALGGLLGADMGALEQDPDASPFGETPGH